MNELTETEKAIVSVLTKRLAPDDAVIKVIQLDEKWLLIGYNEDGVSSSGTVLEPHQVDLFKRVFATEEPRVAYTITRAELTAVKRRWKIEAALV